MDIINNAMYLSPHNINVISQEGYDLFCKEGFLPIPAIIPANLIQRLRQLFDFLMDPSDTTDKVVVQNKGQMYVTNLENVCNKGNFACLELLGYPSVLSIAETICGTDFFLIQEFAVNKNRGDELPVLWHQDMRHQRSGNCFTMGIYLDDVEVGDGALKVVPGSHLDNRSICELSKEPCIEVAMKAGDVLIHDMMLAH
ncbi:MAG: phytanoyl-CoA dioxygenase family protein [Chitinophagaceae bacterium]|nr:phytanoyl-CoA dioxygenase family protein [Chitinophagaceae bacterium]